MFLTRSAASRSNCSIDLLGKALRNVANSFSNTAIFHMSSSATYALSIPLYAFLKDKPPSNKEASKTLLAYPATPVFSAEVINALISPTLAF